MSNDRRVIGIGSPTASLESNFALRELVGAAHFFAGVSSFDHTLTMRIREVLSTGAARAASLRDAERADAVLVLGEDISNTAPRLALSLRQAVRGPAWELADKLGISHWNDYVVRDAARALQSPLFIASAMATSLDDIATATWRGAPDDLARLGFAVAHAINAKIPTVAGLTSEERDFAEVVAASMKHAEWPLVVAGSGCNSRAIIEAAANVAWSLNGAKLCYAVPECNSMGLAAMASGDLETAVAMLQEGPAATVVVLENDLYRRADSDIVDKIFARAAGVIAIDYVNHATIKRADVVLPTSTFAEAAGTLINNEGRAQRFFQVLAPAGDIQESWRWLGQLAEARGIDGWRNLDDVIIACANRMPTLAGIIEAAPLSDFRIHGMRVNRQPHRFSGRTAIHANVSVHEPQPPQDADAPMSFSMEGYSDKPPAAVVPFYWAPGWNSVQALNKFQAEVGGPLRGGDAGVRLIEPSPDARPPFFTPIVMPFSPRPDELWIVPCHHLFGSDPLSVLTPGIAARAPKPYLMVHPEEMRDFTSGERVTLMLGAITLQLTLELQTDMPRGVAGLPVGLPGIPFVAIPAWGRVRKEASP